MDRIREVRVLDSGPSCPELPLVEGGGVARAVVRPEVGAEKRSMNLIRLKAAARTMTLSHPMEAVYYVMSGAGSVVDPADLAAQPLVVGSMVHIEPDTRYAFIAGPHGMEIIGGPCPADPALYAARPA